MRGSHSLLPSIGLLPVLLCSLYWSSLLPVGESAAVATPPAVSGCEYGGKLYVAGAKFRPDPCSKCHCPRRGGEVKCFVSDCLVDQHCITFRNKTKKQCCAECEERGCKSTDGKMFSQGEVIKSEPCVRCYCPLGGGNPVCDVTSCPLSECVDPVKIPGVCCPTCPNGANCQIGLLTLPIGQTVDIEGATCKCESFRDQDGVKRTLARCNKDKAVVNN